MGEVDVRDGSYDPSDPYERQAQTFPQLSEEHLQRLAKFGDARDYPTGTFLFRRGERSVDFFVVIEGAVEILDSGTGRETQVIHSHGDRQFTG